MSGLGAQRGQATVEWVGLLLGVALGLGALVAGGREAAKGESAAGVGEAVAERITCAARGSCGAGSAGPGALREGPSGHGGALRGGVRGSLRGRPDALRESSPGVPGSLRGRPDALRESSPGAPGSLRRPPDALRGVRPSAPWEKPPRLAVPDGLPLRGAAGLARRAWILCLGYRRLRYEVDHPLTPRQSVPVRETLDMVNDCVNPLAFLFG